MKLEFFYFCGWRENFYIIQFNQLSSHDHLYHTVRDLFRFYQLEIINWIVNQKHKGCHNISVDKIRKQEKNEIIINVLHLLFHNIIEAEVAAEETF